MTYPSPFVPPRPGRAATGERVTEKLGAAMRAANSTRTNQVCHMNAIVRRTIASIATAILSMGLISACAGREEGEKMEPCTGTIFTLRTAILYPLIDSFPYLTVYSTDAQVVDGTPEAEVRVEWDEGVNRPANLNETLKLGESATPSRRSGPSPSSAWSLPPTASAGRIPWCASNRTPSSWILHASTPPTTTSTSAPMTRRHASHDSILRLRPRRDDAAEGQEQPPLRLNPATTHGHRTETLTIIDETLHIG